jgi:acyl CoA:acetate/3-ketoacid CoA transferase
MTRASAPSALEAVAPIPDRAFAIRDRAFAGVTGLDGSAHADVVTEAVEACFPAAGRPRKLILFLLGGRPDDLAVTDHQIFYRDPDGRQ